MNGCEYIKCPHFKDGHCCSEVDSVDEITGEDICPRHERAIPRKISLEEIRNCLERILCLVTEGPEAYHPLAIYKAVEKEALKCMAIVEGE